MSGESASGPLLSTALAATTLNNRGKFEKGVPEGTPNF